MADHPAPSPEKSPAGAKPAKPAGTSKPKGKGKKKKPPTVPLKQRVAEALKQLKAQVAEVFQSLRSPDRPTRRMSLFFFASLIGAVAVSSVTVTRMIRQKRELARRASLHVDAATQHAHHAAEIEKADKRRLLSMMDLGMFTVELKTYPGQKAKSGVGNMAEIQLIVECDDPETHDYLEAHLTQARNQITNVFVAMDRDELLTRDGKRKLKRLLMEKLNGWIPKGKVEEVYFSKLTVA